MTPPGTRLTFPSPLRAGPDGLLAVGGDLSVDRLLLAYRSGIFPWYNDGQPILWFSPDPRCVLLPGKLRVTKSLQRVIRSGRFETTWDRDFRAVITRCRHIKRPGQDGTWITTDMLEAYCRLHDAGHAHSVEVRQDGVLAGGLYGVVVGRCFCGESMFTEVPNASKIAFAWLAGKLESGEFDMIDCQLPTPHLLSLGAQPMPRREFLRRLKAAVGGR